MLLRKWQNALSKKNATLKKIEKKCFSANVYDLKNERNVKQAKIIQVGLTNPDKIELDPIKTSWLYTRKSFFLAGGTKFEQNQVWYNIKIKYKSQVNKV